jgi:ankyrin repeat protein
MRLRAKFKEIKMTKEIATVHKFILVLLTGFIAGLSGCASSPVAESKIKDESPQTALYRAARYGDIKAVNRLLKAGADANAYPDDDANPLYIASQNGHTQIVHALLISKANVDATVYGRTPLFVASKEGHFEIVKLLLESGADVNAVTKTGVNVDLTRLTPEGRFPAKVSTLTPLRVAEQNGHYDIVKLLRDHGGK